MKNFQIAAICVLSFLFCLVTPALGGPAHNVERRQAPSKIDGLKKNLTPIGNLTKTQHKVEGMVWTYNDSTIIIENFVFDGKGFGTFIHVATEGSNLREFTKNRQIIGYPDPDDVTKPIEREYKKEDNNLLVVRLPANIKTSEVKWLSIWCDIFNTSFGHVLFP